MLEDIMVLTKNVMNDQGNWRCKEVFLMNLGK